MKLSRRETIKLLGMATASVLVGGAPSLSAELPQPQPIRMPLEDFVKVPRLLAALRKGVLEMKRRKPSDPLSWFYQAAIHGVTEQAITNVAKDDPDVEKVFRKRYWNQCPHDGENSANFLPWHRGYTYYFEKILRMHSGEADFALPYWNYTEPGNRKFPKEFGIEHLDGDLSNNTPANINPLYMDERDFYFTRYEHPFAKGLPLVQLSDEAVDIRLPMNATVFFGDIEREGLGGGIADEDPSTRGLLESYPHDHIHRAVGGIVIAPEGTVAVGAMATPPTAGFDPIFPIHHSNIDRLWAKWSCMPGKTWGKRPSAYWFNERPWFFFDIDGKAVNEPRKKYFDYRALGVRFSDDDPSCTPLALPDIPECPPPALLADRAVTGTRRVETIVQSDLNVAVLPTTPAVVAIPAVVTNRLRTAVSSLRANAFDGGRQRLLMQLKDLRLGFVEGTGFDIHLTTNPDANLTRASASFVGSVALFRHEMPTAPTDDHTSHPGGNGMTETFDISRAVAAVEESSVPQLKLVVVPYPLLTVPRQSTVFVTHDFLTFRGVEFGVMQ